MKPDQMAQTIDINPSVDLELIVQRRKAQWMREARRTLSIQDRVGLSVPWWLIIIAAALFALSAGHTIGVFNQLSSVGYAAPFAVEFALLWVAFSRVSLTKISFFLRILEWLAFIIAIVVNAIGAAERIAVLTHLDKLSFGDLTGQFGSLPFVTQGLVIIIPLFALFVPIGTWAAGEGLANLILRGQRHGNLLDERWDTVARMEIQQALFAELTRRGLSAPEAKRTASALSAGYLGGRVQEVSPRPSVAVQPDAPLVSASSLPAPVHSAPADGADKRTWVVHWLSDHPDEVDTISVRKLAEATGVSKTLAHEVLSRFRENRNA